MNKVGAAVAMLVFGACWRDKQEPTPPMKPATDDTTSPQPYRPAPQKPQTPVERMMAAFVEFEQKMCACTDSQCARDVADEITEWSKQEAARNEPRPDLSDEDTKRASEIGQHMGECMQRAMSQP